MSIAHVEIVQRAVKFLKLIEMHGYGDGIIHRQFQGPFFAYFLYYTRSVSTGQGNRAEENTL